MGASALASSGLDDWQQHAGENWNSILLGNGSSRAVWDSFKYQSLYEVAQGGTTHPLSRDDQALFTHLGNTTNFEAVLGALATSRTVCKALHLQTDKIEQRYASIRDALIASVHKVHVPWASVPPRTLKAIGEALLEYEFVFSTNYDLLVYWSMMAGDPNRFRDYFWNDRFDISDTEIWRKATRVLYLHGALHLYYGEDGGTYKEVAGQAVNLLDIFARRPDGVPLCITEGSPRQKLAAIGRSDYLSFCLHQLGIERGPIVILGQGLGDTDRHLADALARHRGRVVAVGIYPIDETQVIQEKARFRQLLPHATLIYFDSKTHPLALPALRVGP